TRPSGARTVCAWCRMPPGGCGIPRACRITRCPSSGRRTTSAPTHPTCLMAEKKKFLVGKGKKIRGRTGGGSSGSPLTGSAANGSQPLPPSGAPRRFFVGEGKKVERAPPPPRTHAYGVPNRPTGSICAHPERTGHVPFCPFFTTALYVCEEADRKTVVQLAHVAGESIQALER